MYFYLKSQAPRFKTDSVMEILNCPFRKAINPCASPILLSCLITFYNHLFMGSDFAIVTSQCHIIEIIFDLTFLT